MAVPIFVAQRRLVYLPLTTLSVGAPLMAKKATFLLPFEVRRLPLLHDRSVAYRKLHINIEEHVGQRLTAKPPKQGGRSVFALR